MSEPIEGGKKIHFSYNHEGLRTQKKVEYADKTVTTDYLLHGKLVAHQTVTETDLSGNVLSVNEMHFVYDNEPRPAMVKFNGIMYFYRHNLQGDIVGIVDENGSPVVEYKYNAWGKPLATTVASSANEAEKSKWEALARLNPFRYRGYMYDEESGLYYCTTFSYRQTAKWQDWQMDQKLYWAKGDAILMKFNDIIWADSDLDTIVIEYDRAVLTIWNDMLQKKLYVHCTGFAGITNLCIWDDTIIMNASVSSITAPINDFTRSLFSKYDMRKDYGGRSLSDGVIELKIELANYLSFCLYCKEISVETE